MGANPTPIGPMEQILQQMFSQASPGIGGQLNSLAMGVLPKPMQEWITATTNEQFGGLGARFGTDLATATSRGLGQAGAAQSLGAINQILGLGGTTTGFEFQRSDDAFDRALQEWITSQQFDPMNDIFAALLGG